jgi:hypothetical protein
MTEVREKDDGVTEKARRHVAEVDASAPFRNSTSGMAADIKREVKLEIVHVLFLDIVGYSKALTDEQQELIDRLNQAVRGSEEFQKAVG